ncbi:MAG TPA: PIN domain-containing protein [Candidatus Sulfotelmatobacter sp.]|nr:PIN domain-containing protein [Candidatus Sulfotelmatobacter sp.]
MRVALDTNILAYLEGINGPRRREVAEELISKLPEESTFLPVQGLGELFRVLVGKARWAPLQARTAILSWRNTFPVVETSPALLLSAMDLAVDHRLDIWDAVILAASAAAGCRLLLSEDLQEGFTWGGVTVVNPFAVRKNELLEELLDTE